MPPLYYMNAPPHPFWDFVSGMEDHPFFAQHRQQGPDAEQAQAEATASASTTNVASGSEKTKGKQAEVSDDPPEVDPTTVRPNRKDMPFRGRGRFSKAFDGDDNDANEKNDDSGEGERHRGKRGCHGHRRSHDEHGPGGPGRHGPWGRGGPHGGPPPFMFGGNFPFGPHGPFGRPGGPEHPDHEGHGPRGGFRGRGGPHRGGRWGHGPHGHHGPRSRSPPRGGPFARGDGGFDLGSFLNNLGTKIGVDLTSAASGLGLNMNAPRSAESDFEPRTDIFDTLSHYTIHLSLPGAKKSDVGVDWDGEHSALRIAGVVHRPNIDEEMMARLVVDGRKRETGVFEKIIRLGTPREPASINVEAITAKMVDGVLVVKIPKVEKTFAKKEVRVDGSNSPAAAHEQPEDAYMNEKDLLFDAEEDREMYEAEHRHETPAPETAKDTEARDDRSETVGFEHPAPDATAESLPRYEVDEPAESKVAKETSHDENENLSDWEKDGSEDEGEYVKINVD